MTYNNINWHMDKGYYVNRKYGSLHRYIYTQHNGTIPEGYIVHHKNEDKLDNSPKNLIMMTRGEHQKLHNMGNTYRLGKHHTEAAKQKMSTVNKGKTCTEEHKQKMSEALKGKTKGEINGMSKLTTIDVKAIKTWLLLGYTVKELATLFEVCETTIFRIKSGFTWSHVTIGGDVHV